MFRVQWLVHLAKGSAHGLRPDLLSSDGMFTSTSHTDTNLHHCHCRQSRLPLPFQSQFLHPSYLWFLHTTHITGTRGTRSVLLTKLTLKERYWGWEDAHEYPRLGLVHADVRGSTCERMECQCLGIWLLKITVECWSPLFLPLSSACTESNDGKYRAIASNPLQLPTPPFILIGNTSCD
jgi:hypothetical protein